MSSELATELHRSGDAHATASCLLYRAAIEHAQDKEIPDPVAFALNGQVSLSIHYLLGLGLELMLKAAIVALDSKTDEKCLRNDIGHDLVIALDEAEHRGFETAAPHLREIIALLRDPYRLHWFRYKQPDEMPLPGDFDQVVQMLNVLEREVAAIL